MAEALVHLTVKRLPEGVYLATSRDVPGLVAQGRTLAETLEIASDVARKMIDSRREHGAPLPPRLRRAGKSELVLTIPIGVA